MNARFLVIAAAVLAGSAAYAKNIFNCSFESGKWDKKEFIEVKSSRWDNVNTFRQDKCHIVNVCPKDATPQEMLSKRAPETYAAMIWKTPVKGKKVTITSHMSFDYRMAPSIVIAEKPGVSKAGFPEFRTHYEVVLFDQGLNVWRHWFKDGKQVWRKVGFLKCDFKPNTKYELQVNIQFTARGPVWTVNCGGHEFGFIDDLMPKEFYAGIVACEGVNRFYDFRVDK